MQHPDQNILIVEDSNVQARIIARHLEAVTPFATTQAATLAEARDLLGGGDSFFAAILDLNLPDDPDRGIVDLAVGAGVPSVVMTANFDEALRDELIAKNVVDYFLKTMPELSNLVDCIERLYKNLSVKVLVADDSRTARRQVARLLANQNYQTLEAGDGVEALDVLVGHPDVRMVITDYNMPRMDGFELIGEIRKIHPRNKLAVVGISAQSGPLTARFIKHGANDFVTKPIQAEEFYCRINQQMDLLDALAAAANCVD